MTTAKKTVKKAATKKTAAAKTAVTKSKAATKFTVTVVRPGFKRMALGLSTASQKTVRDVLDHCVEKHGLDWNGLQVREGDATGKIVSIDKILTEDTTITLTSKVAAGK
jgi:hypothetical protein